MAAVVIGVLLLALKLFDIDPVRGWGWPWVLSPFFVAIAWWTWSDLSGRTSRVALRQMDERRAERRRHHLVSLGLDPRLHDEERKRADAHRRAREREAERIEGKRAAVREQHRHSILASRQDSPASQASADEASTRPSVTPPRAE